MNHKKGITEKFTKQSQSKMILFIKRLFIALIERIITTTTKQQTKKKKPKSFGRSWAATYTIIHYYLHTFVLV